MRISYRLATPSAFRYAARAASPPGGECVSPSQGEAAVVRMRHNRTPVDADTPAEDHEDAVGEQASSEGARHSRRRLWGMRALVALGSLLLVVGALAVWVKRVALEPGTWSDTSAKALQNDTVRQTLATYLVDQLYANVDVAARIRTALPQRAKPLAAPIAAGLEEQAQRFTAQALA